MELFTPTSNRGWCALTAQIDKNKTNKSIINLNSKLEGFLEIMHDSIY
jgi:hypothetical protein